MESRNVENSGYVLIIERGRSRFPQRPIQGERFLIGGGSNCQLQLGGQMPLLHSIILNESGHLWIDAVVNDPPLLVNGQAVREGELRHGDLIEIGSFLFSVEQQDITVSTEQATPDEPLEYLQFLSHELETLQQLAANKNMGMHALLGAMARLNAASRIDVPEVIAAAENAPAIATPDTQELSLSQLELMEQQEAADQDQADDPSLRKTA